MNKIKISPSLMEMFKRMNMDNYTLEAFEQDNKMPRIESEFYEIESIICTPFDFEVIE